MIHEDSAANQSSPGAALSPDENIAWDDDSDTDSQPSTLHAPSSKTPKTITQQSDSSTVTIQAPTTDDRPRSSTSTLKPTDGHPRRSQDQSSQADSDASYDLVSGATSRAPGSPKDEKEKEVVHENEQEMKKKEKEEEDEPDWE